MSIKYEFSIVSSQRCRVVYSSASKVLTNNQDRVLLKYPNPQNQGLCLGVIRGLIQLSDFKCAIV